MRERVEDQLDAPAEVRKRKQVQDRPDPKDVLAEVKDFVALARSGACLAGDRRVSPKERTRWRITSAPRERRTYPALDDDVDTAALAVVFCV